MACYDPETHEFPERARRKWNHITQMLCRVCGNLESAGVFPNDVELLAWWEEHKKVDKLRIQKDNLERELQSLRNAGKNDAWGSGVWEKYVATSDKIRSITEI